MNQDENQDGKIDWKDGLGGDLLRMGIVLLAIIVLGFVDTFVTFGATFAYMTAVLSSTSVVLFIAAASHLMRKIFFPGIKVTELVKESMSHPIGAAVSFLAIAIVLSALIVVNVILLN